MYFQNSLIVSVRKAKHERLFVLQEPLICIDDTGRTWTVPKGFTTDFASIPAIGRAFIPKAHPNAYAAVLHDFLYETQPLKRRETDQLFREALFSPDCDTNAATRWVMYKAVRSGGATAWQKAQNKLNSTPAMETLHMSDDIMIKEEKGAFAKFLDWFKRVRTKTDQELDELEDEVRLRANKLFRRANWPGIKEREILYKNKMQNDYKFWVSYVLIFASSCITLWFWCVSSPEWQNGILFGVIFFIGNMLMPVWARLTFWRGGGSVELLINAIGLAMLIGVATASVVASIGLQGMNNDQSQAIRAQQQVAYQTKLAESKALKNRIDELRQATTRAPNEIKSELDGLLLSEPSPQSGCRSRDNYGSWSKRNCSRVSSLRAEMSQSNERIGLERKAENLTFKDVPAVNSVDPLFDIADRYLDTDKKTFNEAMPVMRALFLEFFFDMFTVVLALSTGALVREDLAERVARQRRDLINQAEAEVAISKKPAEPEPVFAALDPSPEPLTPAPASIQVEQPIANVPEGFVLVPETKTETVTETTREITSATLTNVGSTPFLEATDPAPVEIIETTVFPPENQLLLPVIKEIPEVEAVAPQNTITEVVDPMLKQEVAELTAKVEAQNAAQTMNDDERAAMKAEILQLRFNKLAIERATPAEVQQIAQYAADRWAYQVGSNILLAFALKDYEAWCTLKGLAFNKPIEDFRALIVDDLGLDVSETAEGEVILVDTEFKVGV